MRGVIMGRDEGSESEGEEEEDSALLRAEGEEIVCETSSGVDLLSVLPDDASFHSEELKAEASQGSGTGIGDSEVRDPPAAGPDLYARLERWLIGPSWAWPPAGSGGLRLKLATNARRMFEQTGRALVDTVGLKALTDDEVRNR